MPFLYLPMSKQLFFLMTWPQISSLFKNIPSYSISFLYLTPLPSKMPFIKVPLIMQRLLSRASPIEVFLSYSMTPQKFLCPKKSILLEKQATFLNFSHQALVYISLGFNLLVQSNYNKLFMILDIILSLVILIASILFINSFSFISLFQKISFSQSKLDIQRRTMPKVNIAALSNVSAVFVPLQNRSFGLKYTFLVFLYFFPKLVMKKLQPQSPSILHRMLRGFKFKYSVLFLTHIIKKSAICQKNEMISQAQNLQFCYFLALISYQRESSPRPVVSQKMTSSQAVFCVFLVDMKAGRTILEMKREWEYLAMELSLLLTKSESIESKC